MIEVSIAVEGELRDHCIALLGQLGFEGFWEDEELLRGYVTDCRWSPALLTEVQRTLSLITPASSHTTPALQVRQIEEKNWNEEWEKTIQPIRVSPRMVIRPSWQSYTPAAGDIVLTIDPKMSFGTGYHESTRLVLQLMERYLPQRSTVLDVGTGTGVLAIAAVLLGASAATGVDIDEWSYANARENVRLNGLADRVTILSGDLSAVPPGRYDLIAANIQKSVLLPMLSPLNVLLQPHGILLLSGLLAEDRLPMESALQEQGFALKEFVEDNGWVGIAAQV